MTNTIVITQVNNSVLVTEDVNDVIISSVGVQGATGATGATGAQGSSGVVTVNAPLTNAGTSSAANLSISAGTTSAAGALQLTDSVASTSTTTAATPNAVKTAYDFADSKLLKYGTPWQTTYRSTYWYEAKIGTTLTTGTLNQQNRVYAYPLFILESVTLDRIAVECNTAVASTTIRLGIYSVDSDGVPSSLVLDAGTVSTATTGFKAITISQTLSAGLYYLAFVWQGGATSPTMRALSRQTGNWTPIASTSQQTDGYASGYYTDGVTGALGAFGTASVISNNPARIQFRIA